MKKQLSEKKPASLYHFFGEESFLKNHYISKIKELLIQKDTACFNYVEFDGSVSAEDFEGAVLTPPLMSDKKVVYLKDTGIFSGSQIPAADIFSDMPDYLYIILNEDKFDKRNAAYKAFSKNGVSVECEKRTRAEIKLYISKDLTKRKKKISPADMEYLLDVVGNDMYSVIASLDKLSAYIEDKDTITKKEIDAVLVREFMSAEYILTDALIKGDRKKSFEALYELFAMQTDAVRLLYIIASAYLSVYKAAALLADRMPQDKVAAELKLPGTFLAKKYINLASGAKLEDFAKAIELIQDADYRIKLGLIKPTLGIETLCSQLLEI